MASLEEKFKKSKRRLKTNKVIEKQAKIAKSRGIVHSHNQPHRYAKHHALDCGTPNCMLCGNPRKIYKEKTIQERRQEPIDGFFECEYTTD